MPNLTTSIAKTQELQKSAQKTLQDGDFVQAEKFYRAALNLLGTVMDPMHQTYIEILDGLLVCLEKQHKAEDARDVELLLKQLRAGN